MEVSFVFNSPIHLRSSPAASRCTKQWRCSSDAPSSKARKPRRKQATNTAATTDLVVDIRKAGRSGPRTPALFLHGFMMDMTIFDEMLGNDSCLLKMARCARFDLRGFGSSPNPVGPYSHLDDIATVQSMTGKGAAHIVACDMGGMLALEYAIKYPDSVKSISLISSGLPGHMWNRGNEAYFELPRFEDPEGGPPDSKERQILGRHIARAWVIQSPEWSYARNKDEKLAARLDKMLNSYKAFHFWGEDEVEPNPSAFEQPLRLRLKQVQAPVMVMVGDNEMSGVYEDFGRIAEDIIAQVPSPAFGDRTVRILNGSGHFGAIEAWSQCCEHVAEFWQLLKK